MRICPRCGKPREEFRGKRKDAQCMVCYREKDRARQATDGVRERKRMWNRLHIDERRDLWLSRTRAWRSKLPREYNYNTPEKWRARNGLHRALKSGKALRPDHCSECGVECKPEAHHPDYSKPIDIVWLCRRCHGKTRIKGPIDLTHAAAVKSGDAEVDHRVKLE